MPGTVIATNSSNNPKYLKVNVDRELYTAASEDTYHYETWDDATTGTTQTIWTPASGKSVHITHMCFSLDKAGTVEIYDNASGTTIAIFEIGAKGSEHVTLGGDLVLAADNLLGVKLTSGGGTTVIHFTAFGHEH